MASNVFPMLSSSPPPIDDCPDDDDDDDEFGNFTSANIPFDSSFDSPVAVEKFKPFKTGDNGVNDANFSNEIHKFNSFSNLDTPSPQEFVPNFTVEEEEHCHGGFTPIKTESCKIVENNLNNSSIEDSISHRDIQVTSHKPVPIKSEFHIPSSNKSELKISDGCDTQDSTFSNSLDSNAEEKTVRSEHSSLEKIPICDSPDNTVDKLALNFCEDERTDKTCNGFISESIPSSAFENNVTKIESVAVAEEICLSSDKFECDFNSEENEFDCDEFSDFKTSENLVTSNHGDSSSIKSLEDKCLVSSDKDSLEVNKESKSDLTCDPVLAKLHEFSDNEFDDFQSCAEKINFDESTDSAVKSNDDFDDFQDFQHSKDSNEKENDFANFQDFSSGDASNPDDFADFSAVPFDSNKMANSTESCEFADFEEASFSAPVESSFQLSSSSSQKNVDPLSTVINTIFPLCDHEEIDTSEETSPQILEQTNKSRRLWEKLHEVEQTPGLRFQWGVSHSFQQLLRSVNVDYHSILRTSSVPIFASGLSLLEPVKGLSSSANHESDDRNLFPKDPIPPVEFDWNSSGLINPLDLGQAASTLMDLSFLSSVETNSKASSSDFSLENELLKPSPPLQCPESSSRTQILEQLLSKNVSSLPNSKITHRPSDLSDEAVRVLDQLPDLSFMQAKVLMFPISNKT